MDWYTSCTGVPWLKSGVVSPVILPMSAASSLTCPKTSSFGPLAGRGSFSSANPLWDAIWRILGWREAIKGLARITSDRLAPYKFNRGGMVAVLLCLVLVEVQTFTQIWAALRPEIRGFDWRPTKPKDRMKARKAPPTSGAAQGRSGSVARRSGELQPGYWNLCTTNNYCGFRSMASFLPGDWL